MAGAGYRRRQTPTRAAESDLGTPLSMHRSSSRIRNSSTDSSIPTANLMNRAGFLPVSVAMLVVSFIHSCILRKQILSGPEKFTCGERLKRKAIRAHTPSSRKSVLWCCASFARRYFPTADCIWAVGQETSVRGMPSAWFEARRTWYACWCGLVVAKAGIRAT